MYNIKNIRITHEALTDIVSLVNRAKTEGLVDVKASVDENFENLSFELTYKSNESSEPVSRHINVPLRNEDEY